MMQQQWPHLQMKLVLDDCMKIIIWWGGNDTFDRAGCKFGEEIPLTIPICCTCLTITYADLRAANKHVLIPSYVIQVI